MPYTYVPSATKVCNDCGVEKPGKDFPKRSRCIHGFTKTCWDCYRPKHLDYQKRWRAKPEGKKSVAAGKIRARYGISSEQLDEMLLRQSGLCAICETHPESGTLRIDHDHATGRVRSLLCNACNVGLGQFGDDISLLERSIAYLREN